MFASRQMHAAGALRRNESQVSQEPCMLSHMAMTCVDNIAVSFSCNMFCCFNGRA